MEKIILSLTNQKQVDYILNHKVQKNIQEGFIYEEHISGQSSKQIGIDNTTGNAITKEFDSLEDCVKWLTKETNPEYIILFVSKINRFGAYTKVN